MCDMCRVSPCHPRCPNAGEPLSVGNCENCSEPIQHGDKYVEINEKLYHEDCVCDIGVWEILEMLGVKRKTVE